MEFLAWWVLKSKVFAQKSTVVKWNCFILWIDIVWGQQNLGLILESKVVQKLSLEKMVLTKNILLNWYSSMKKTEKISDGFWLRKMNLKVILTLFDTSSLHQFSKFNNFLWAYWFLDKNLSSFVPPAKKLDNPYYHSLYINFHLGRILIIW